MYHSERKPSSLKRERGSGTPSRVTEPQIARMRTLNQPLPRGRGAWGRVTEKRMDPRHLGDKGKGIHLQVLTLVVQRLTA